VDEAGSQPPGDVSPRLGAGDAGSGGANPRKAWELTFLYWIAASIASAPDTHSEKLVSWDLKNVADVLSVSASRGTLTGRRRRTRRRGESIPLSARVGAQLRGTRVEAGAAQVQTDRPGRAVRTRHAGVSTAEDRSSHTEVAKIRVPAWTGTAPVTRAAAVGNRVCAPIETRLVLAALACALAWGPLAPRCAPSAWRWRRRCGSRLGRPDWLPSPPRQRS
jgi:hypothetical protein